MNINPFGLTIPHYDSYEDFYKFFEVYPKEVKEGMPIEVFPPVKPPEPEIEKEEKSLRSEEK